MSHEKEQALLGGLMKLNNKDSEVACYVLDTLKAKSFYNAVHCEIFKAILTLYKQDKLFDNLSVIQFLQTNQLVSMVDVDRCYQHYADSALMREYAKSVRESAQERYSLAKIQDLIDVVNNPDNGNIQQRLGLCESAISGLIDQMQNRNISGLRDGYQIANEWLDAKEAFHAGTLKPYELGITGIDEILAPRGVLPGSLVVVGARPKMGKTFTAVKSMEHMLKTTDKAVCAFSMEMNASDIWERTLATKGQFNSDLLYTNNFDNTQLWDRVGTLNTELANSRLFIDDGTNLTVSHIKNEVRKVHRKNPVGMIMVDYLTLMEGEEAERNDLKYGAITKQLKSLAKELECVVLLLTQLNRGLESRTDKRPVPSDSRDTGQIEQDCDLWIGLYREGVYNDECGHNLTEAIVRLNRAGQAGTAYMQLMNGYMQDVSTVEAHNMLEEIKTEREQDEEKSTFSKSYARNKPGV